jgi:hypothetical protein
MTAISRNDLCNIARSLATRATHNTAAITIAWIAMLQTLTAILTRSWRSMRIAPAMRTVISVRSGAK